MTTIAAVLALTLSTLAQAAEPSSVYALLGSRCANGTVSTAQAVPLQFEGTSLTEMRAPHAIQALYFSVNCETRQFTVETFDHDVLAVTTLPHDGTFDLPTGMDWFDLANGCTARFNTWVRGHVDCTAEKPLIHLDATWRLIPECGIEKGSRLMGSVTLEQCQ